MDHKDARHFRLHILAILFFAVMAVYLGVLRVVAPGEAVGLLLEVELGPAEEYGQIQHPVEGQLLRLARPLLPGVPPDLGGDVHPAPVVPLGQAQGEALGVGAAGGAAVNAAVVLRGQDGLVLECGGDPHGDPSFPISKLVI